MADFGIGAAILGSAALSGITGFLGNKSAAEAQSEAAATAARATGEASEAAIAEQRRQYDQTRSDLAPYREAGRLALGDLAGMIQTSPQGFTASGEFNNPFTYQPGAEFTQAYQYDASPFMAPETLGTFSQTDLENDPGYVFRQREGEKALQRGAAAKGLSLSGGALKDLSRFNQGLASDEYGKAYGRYLDRYNARIADVVRRQDLSRYSYETGQADLARRQSLGYQQYGSVLADLARRYGIATDEYNTGRQASDTQFNRLAALGGIGQTGVGQTASAGAAAAGNIANAALSGGSGQAAAALQAGQAKSAGILGSYGSINQAAQGGIQNALTLRQLELDAARPVVRLAAS